MTHATAVGILRQYQRQIDPEGIEVGVSRQALDEVLDRIEELEAEVADLQEAVKIYKKTLKDKQECMNALTGWR